MTEENKNINNNENEDKEYFSTIAEKYTSHFKPNNEDKKHDPDNIVDLASATVAANERAAKFTEQQVNLKYDTGMKPSEKTGYVRTRPDLEVNYWAVEILDAAGQNQIVPLFLQGREFENFPTRHYMAAVPMQTPYGSVGCWQRKVPWGSSAWMPAHITSKRASEEAGERWVKIKWSPVSWAWVLDEPADANIFKDVKLKWSKKLEADPLGYLITSLKQSGNAITRLDDDRLLRMAGKKL